MVLSEEIKAEMIRECIGLWEDKFGDSIYNECLETLKQIGLDNFVALKSIIRRFLYVWGKMGRVLGRQEYMNWESRIISQIEVNRKELEEIRAKELANTDLDSLEPAIKECYKSFCEVIGPIATAKTLHLICPTFFPLWDNAIANAVREERAKKDDEFSPTDYFNFMKDTQNFITKHNQVLSELVIQFQTGKVRIVDRLFWWMAHRPLSLVLT